MAYVEWLRVRNTLRGFAIVLGVLLVIAVIGRITTKDINPFDGRMSLITQSPTAHVTTETFPGGTKTIVNDPAKNVHAEYSDYGNGHKAYSIVPIKPGTSFTIDNGRNGHIHLTSNGLHGEDNTQMDMTVISVIALIAGGIVACFLGGSLGKENEQVAFAWTKPIDRNLLALRMIGADFVGILAAMALAVVASILCVMMFAPVHIVPTADSWDLVAMLLILPFGWYAFVTVVTTSLKRRNSGLIAGLYLGALILPGMAKQLLFDAPVAIMIHGILKFVAFFDPITYLNSAPSADHSASYFTSPAVNLEVLLTLTIVYLAASIVQWRRLEV